MSPSAAAAASSASAPSGHYVSVLAVKAFLAAKGIASHRKRNPAVAALIDELQSVAGYVSLADIVRKPIEGNTLVKAMLGRLVMPDFKAFSAKLTEMYQTAATAKAAVGATLSRVQEEIRSAAGSDTDFTIAVCTVDGQQFTYGTASKPIPLMETVKPLLYATALTDCGRAGVHEVRLHHHACSSPGWVTDTVRAVMHLRMCSLLWCVRVCSGCPRSPRPSWRTRFH